MADWIETTIGEQATLQRGFDITKAEQRIGNVPVISSGGTSSYHDTALIKGPGVVLGRKGVVGSVYFIASDYWPHDTTLWVKDFHGNDQRFVYYFFKHLTPWLIKMDVGSANPTLNRNHVHPMPTVWPPLPEQKAISNILGTLDDKIELNRKMNETLEEIARAIFKSWFIDFDPVRAKAEGRWKKSQSLPGMPAEMYDLWPDSFVGSSLGPIPKGWKAGKIGDFCNVQGGFAYKSEDFTDSGHPVIKIKNIQQDKSVDFDDIQFISKDLANNTEDYWLNDGDLVMAMTGATVGKFGLIVNKYAWRAVLNQRVARLKSHLKGDDKIWFVYCILCLEDIFYQVVSIADGSAQPNISADGIMSTTAFVPDDRIIYNFNSTVEPLFQNITFNIKQSHTLGAIRDSLLPKLLSGEIRVKDAVKFIEGIT